MASLPSSYVLRLSDLTQRELPVDLEFRHILNETNATARFLFRDADGDLITVEDQKSLIDARIFSPDGLILRDSGSNWVVFLGKYTPPDEFSDVVIVHSDDALSDEESQRAALIRLQAVWRGRTVRSVDLVRALKRLNEIETSANAFDVRGLAEREEITAKMERDTHVTLELLTKVVIQCDSVILPEIAAGECRTILRERRGAVARLIVEKIATLEQHLATVRIIPDAPPPQQAATAPPVAQQQELTEAQLKLAREVSAMGFDIESCRKAVLHCDTSDAAIDYILAMQA